MRKTKHINKKTITRGLDFTRNKRESCRTPNISTIVSSEPGLSGAFHIGVESASETLRVGGMRPLGWVVLTAHKGRAHSLLVEVSVAESIVTFQEIHLSCP